MKIRSFEEALKRLEIIAKRLEEDDIMLDEAVSLYEEGMKLVEFCSKKLEEAENKIKVITNIKDGKIDSEDFDGEIETV
jgi:exodeoxyribonuclease VII small subunit